MHNGLLPATLSHKPDFRVPTQDTSIPEDSRPHSGKVIERTCLVLVCETERGRPLGIPTLRIKTNKTETVRERDGMDTHSLMKQEGT